MNSSYSAVVVTFRRQESLRDVLLTLVGQTLPPALVVVADNDPEGSAESVVAEVAAHASSSMVQYLRVGVNAGPAGGWAAAARVAQQDPGRGDWVAVFDDDDGLRRDDIASRLLSAVDPLSQRIAAVGLRGARLNTRTGLLKRTVVQDGHFEPVDYLASGGIPLYRWTAIDSTGFFDPWLFFGFEDLDLGLRFHKSDRELLVFGLSDHVVQDTSSTRTAWREYFKSRALIIISRRHLPASAAILTTARIFAGGLRLGANDPRSGAFVARLHGLIDGWRRRQPSPRYVPTANPAKSQSDN